MYTFPDKRVTQIGFIVRDINQSAKKYSDSFGLPIPQIITTDPLEIAHTEYRGMPTPAQAKLAFFHLANLDIELIEPDENPSIWKEFLDQFGEGVQHIAFEVENMPSVLSSLAKQGIPLLQKGDYTGGRYAYVDATIQMGVVIELLENFKG
jgi:methylmalonyl-CoA/ethylmalonyl-CoA epimerase